jgi:hypothetical protein
LVRHDLKYGTRARTARTIAKPLAAAGIAIAGITGLVKLIGKFAKKSDEK